MMFFRTLFVCSTLAFAQNSNSLDLDFPLLGQKGSELNLNEAKNLARYAKFPTLLGSAGQCKPNQNGFPFKISAKKFRSVHSTELKGFAFLEIGFCGDYSRTQNMLFALGKKGPKAALLDVCGDQVKFFKDLNLEADLIVGTCASMDRNYFNQRAESYRYFDGHLQTFASLGLVHSDNCNSRDKNRTSENIHATLKSDGQVEIKKERVKCPK